MNTIIPVDDIIITGMPIEVPTKSKAEVLRERDVARRIEEAKFSINNMLRGLEKQLSMPGRSVEQKMQHMKIAAQKAIDEAKYLDVKEYISETFSKYFKPIVAPVVAGGADAVIVPTLQNLNQISPCAGFMSVPVPVAAAPVPADANVLQRFETAMFEARKMRPNNCFDMTIDGHTFMFRINEAMDLPTLMVDPISPKMPIWRELNWEQIADLREASDLTLMNAHIYLFYRTYASYMKAVETNLLLPESITLKQLSIDWAAEMRAAEIRAAEERVAEERAAVEKRVAEERAVVEKRIADERAAAEKCAAEERAAAEKRAAAEERVAAKKRIVEECRIVKEEREAFVACTFSKQELIDLHVSGEGYPLSICENELSSNHRDDCRFLHIKDFDDVFNCRTMESLTKYFADGEFSLKKLNWNDWTIVKPLYATVLRPLVAASVVVEVPAVVLPSLLPAGQMITKRYPTRLCNSCKPDCGFLHKEQFSNIFHRETGQALTDFEAAVKMGNNKSGLDWNVWGWRMDAARDTSGYTGAPVACSGGGRSSTATDADGFMSRSSAMKPRKGFGQ